MPHSRGHKVLEPYYPHRQKRCVACHIEKPLNDFPPSDSAYFRHGKTCLVCKKQQRRGTKHRLLRKTYALSIDDYSALLDAQGGTCAICGRTPEESGATLHVDHDHVTGKLRGILCRSCNHGLGRFQDNIEWLFNAACYLQTCEKRIAQQLQERFQFTAHHPRGVTSVNSTSMARMRS